MEKLEMRVYRRRERAMGSGRELGVVCVHSVCVCVCHTGGGLMTKVESLAE